VGEYVIIEILISIDIPFVSYPLPTSIGEGVFLCLMDLTYCFLLTLSVPHCLQYLFKRTGVDHVVVAYFLGR
jgi:hypothetical protein